MNLAGSQVESAWKQQQKKAALSFGHVSTKTIREQRAGLPIAQLRNELMDAIRDHQCLVVIGETGSGKTVAYLLPMIIHVMDQPELQKDEGPIAVCIHPDPLGFKDPEHYCV